MSDDSLAVVRLVVPRDVTLRPVTDIAPAKLANQRVDPNGFLVGRRGARSAARVVDRADAEFLWLFATPMTIAEAVVTMGRLRGTDPYALLDAVVPFLSECIDAALLVPETSPLAHPIEPLYQRGDRIGSLQVDRVIHVALDSDVYAVRDDGGPLCLKVARGRGDEPGRGIRHEASVLRRIGGVIAPVVRDVGQHDGREFVLTTWHDGETAQGIAQGGGLLRDGMGRRAALRRAADIASSYAELHARGVIHGDVNPSNVILGPRGEITLVDFTLARFTDDEAAQPRGAAQFFWDPDLALSLEAREVPPSASAASDQYGLGAVLYYLLTGRPYLDFALVQSESLRQVVEQAPLSFADRGIPSWTALEDALRRMLDKAPARRFSTLRDAATALRAARVDRGIPLATRRHSGFVSRFLRRVGMDGGVARSGLDQPPLGSLDSGASGIAYALQRIAGARHSADLLAVAEVWTRRATEASGRRGAYGVRGNEGSRMVGRTSLFHAPAGTHFARACVAQSSTDPSALAAAVDAFIRCTTRSDGRRDIIRGDAGTLLACSHLRLLPDLPEKQSASLDDHGDRTSRRLIRLMASSPAVAAGHLPLGMAHGWAGLLYANLLWGQVRGHSVPQWLSDRLDQLARCAEWGPRGARWKWSRVENDPVRSGFMPGWCNGSGGFVALWVLAYERTRLDGYRDLAMASALDAWTHDTMASSLCCGAAGRAYAMLAAFRVSGDREWVKRAYRLADRAIERAEGRPRDPALGSPDGLMRGDGGIAVLLEELALPEWARMPIVEPERWSTSAGTR